MKLRSIFVFTHDSIGLGEDGPTHQSVEHAASLRLIPQHGRLAARATRSRRRSPGRAALERTRRPDVRCCFTRQNVPFVTRDARADRGASRAAATCSPTSRAGRARARSSSPPAPRSPLALGARERARRRRHRRARRVDAVHAACSTARTPRIARACCRAACRASPSKPASPTLAQVRRRRRRSAAGVVGIDRFGESAPAPRAVQALRLHRRATSSTRSGASSATRRAHDDRDPAAPRRSDAPAIARVRIDSWRTTYRGIIPDAYLDAHAGRREHRRCGSACSPQAPNTTSVFVAEHDGEVVGFAAGNMLPEPRYGLDAELSAVYLRREFQRAGIGRRLVRGRRATRSARTARPALIVWVIAGNKAARAFYERARRRAARRAAVRMGRHGLVEAGYGWRDLDALVAAAECQATRH